MYESLRLFRWRSVSQDVGVRNRISYMVTELSGVDLLTASMSDHVYDRHSHDAYAIGVTEAGVQEFRCRGWNHASTKGLVMLFNPQDEHDGHSGSEIGYHYRMLYLDREAFTRTSDGKSRLPLFTSPVIEDDALANLIRTAASAVGDSTTSTLHREACVDEMISYLMTGVPLLLSDVPMGSTAELIAKVQRALAERYAQDLSIDDLTGEFAISRSHLFRAFRAHTGMSIQRYQRMMRVRQAAHLMSRGVPATIAAASCGFVDQSHLHKSFVAQFGVKPGEWKRLSHSSPIGA